MDRSKKVEERERMRRMTAPLAQRILHLAETEHLASSRIGQQLGLPIASVNRILHNRAQATVSVPATTRIKVHSVRQQIHEGNGLGTFPKTKSRRKRRRIE
jgi:hypothetical protein